MRGWFAASVLRDAARFRVKRTGGEIGVGGSGSLSLSDPLRDEIGEMLRGDRGRSRPIPIPRLSEIMILDTSVIAYGTGGYDMI